MSASGEFTDTVKRPGRFVLDLLAFADEVDAVVEGEVGLTPAPTSVGGAVVVRIVVLLDNIGAIVLLLILMTF